MILVDTSVWVEHFRCGVAALRRVLESNLVLCHPFVIGELACGRLRNRGEILGLLGTLPQTPVAEHEEVLTLVEDHKLAGSGIGWVDAHLLASVLLASAVLWTRDRRLSAIATSLGVLAAP